MVNKGNKKAIDYSFGLFKNDGFNGTIEEYKELIQKDEKAKNVAFELMNDNGYRDTIDDFSELLGIEPDSTPGKTIAATEDAASVTAKKKEQPAQPPLPSLRDVVDPLNPSLEKIKVTEPDFDKVVVDSSGEASFQEVVKPVEPSKDGSLELGEVKTIDEINRVYDFYKEEANRKIEEVNIYQNRLETYNNILESGTTPEHLVPGLVNKFKDLYPKYQQSLEEYQKIVFPFAGNLNEWYLGEIKNLPEYQEVIGDKVITTTDQIKSLEDRIASLNDERDNTNDRSLINRPETSQKREKLAAQIEVQQDLLDNAEKTNNDIALFSSGSKYFVGDEEMTQSKFLSFMGSNEYEDKFNEGNTPKLTVTNDDYVQYVMQNDAEAFEVGEWTREFKGGAASFYDIFARTPKSLVATALNAFDASPENMAKTMGILDNISMASGFREAAVPYNFAAERALEQAKIDAEGMPGIKETNIQNRFLINYDTEAKKIAEGIKGAQKYMQQDAIDRFKDGDILGGLKASTKLSIQSSGYLVASMIPKGYLLVGAALQNSSYYDLRRDGVSHVRALVSSGLQGTVGSLDAVVTRGLTKGALQSAKELIGAAAKRGYRMTSSEVAKLGNAVLEPYYKEVPTEYGQGAIESILDQWGRGERIDFEVANRAGQLEASAALTTSGMFSAAPIYNAVYLKSQEFKNIKTLNKRMEGLLSSANELSGRELSMKEMKSKAKELSEVYISTYNTAESRHSKASKSQRDDVAKQVAELAASEAALNQRGIDADEKKAIKAKIQFDQAMLDKTLEDLDNRKIFSPEKFNDKDKLPNFQRDFAIIIDESELFGEIGSIGELEAVEPMSSKEYIVDENGNEVPEGTPNSKKVTRNLYNTSDLIDAGLAKGVDAAVRVGQLVKKRKDKLRRISELPPDKESTPSQREEVRDFKREIKEINEEIDELGGAESRIANVKKILEDLRNDKEYDIGNAGLVDLRDRDAIEFFIAKAVEDGRITENYAAKLLKEDKDGSNAADQQGFVMDFADGSRTIIINKDEAAAGSAVNIAGHEFMHVLMTKTLASDPGLSLALAKSLKNVIDKMETSKLFDSKVSEQIKLYEEKKKDDEGNETFRFDAAYRANEYLTAISDVMAETKYDVIDKTILDELKALIRRILQKAGLRDIKFDDDIDVYNFVKDYNKSIAKGKLTKAQKKLFNKEGAKVGPKIKALSERMLKGVKVLETMGVTQFSKSMTTSDLENELLGMYEQVAQGKMSVDQFEKRSSEIDQAMDDIRNGVVREELPDIKMSTESQPETKPKETTKTKPKAKTDQTKVEGDDKLTKKMIESSAKAQELWLNKPRSWESSIIELFKPITARLVNKRRNVPGFDKENLTSALEYDPNGLYDLIRKYDPERNDSIAAWINSMYEARSVAILARNLDEEFTSNIDDQYGRSDEGSVAPDSYEEETVRKYREDRKKIKIAERILLDKDLLKESRSIVEERLKTLPKKDLTFKNVQNLIPGILSKLVDIPLNKITNPGDNLSTEEFEKALKFIIRNADIIAKTLPDGAVKSSANESLLGTTTGLPPTVLKTFYERKSTRVKTGPGLSPFRKKTGIDGKKFIELLGLDKGDTYGPKRRRPGPRSTTGNTTKGLLNLIGKLITNQLVRESDTITDIERVNLEAGKADIMYSKRRAETITEINSQDIFDGGLEPFGNTERLFEIQFSKKKREEYTKQLTNNRPDLLNPKKEVDKIFEWFDETYPKDSKDKNQILGMTLHWMRNTPGLRFPEDGYKVQQAIRESRKSNIPFQDFPNLNVFLEQFWEEIEDTEALISLKNPDNYPALTDKRVLKGDHKGITIYKVINSGSAPNDNFQPDQYQYAGQNAVRSLIDAHWGRNANPWCLAARTGPNDNMEQAQYFWNRYNRLNEGDNAKGDEYGSGYEIAFYNGNLLALRDGIPLDGKERSRNYDFLGGEGMYFYNNAENDKKREDLGTWWDKQDKPSGDLMITVKEAGFKVVKMIDVEGRRTSEKLKPVYKFKGESGKAGTYQRFNLRDQLTNEEVRSKYFKNVTKNLFNIYSKNGDLLYQRNKNNKYLSSSSNNEKFVEELDNNIAVSAEADGIEFSGRNLPTNILTGSSNVETYTELNYTNTRETLIDNTIFNSQVGEFNDYRNSFNDYIRKNLDLFFDIETSLWPTKKLQWINNVKSEVVVREADIYDESSGLIKKKITFVGVVQSVALGDEVNYETSRTLAEKEFKELGVDQEKRGAILNQFNVAIVEDAGYDDIIEIDDKGAGLRRETRGVGVLPKAYDFNSRTWIKRAAGYIADRTDYAREIYIDILPNGEQRKNFPNSSVDGGVIKSMAAFDSLVEQYPKEMVVVKKALEKGVTDGDIILNENDVQFAKSNKKSKKALEAQEALNKDQEKLAKFNNLKLPSKRRLTGNFTNQDVLDVMAKLDSEREERVKEMYADKDLDEAFNKMVEETTGVGKAKIYDEVTATAEGMSKGKFNFILPPSAEDFMGLMYALMGKGKTGEKHFRFINNNLIRPYLQGVNNVSAARNQLTTDLKNLKKALSKSGADVSPTKLKEKIPGTFFTVDNAIRYHIWTKLNDVERQNDPNSTKYEIPGLGSEGRMQLGRFMNKNPMYQLFANRLISLTKEQSYPTPKSGWIKGNINADLLESLNKDIRAKYLKQFQINAGEMFTDDNLAKLEAIYGADYKDALINSLERMRTGRNTTRRGGKLVSNFTDWVNGSVGAIMFLNTRSAALQLISATNFIDMDDNNLLKASAAFANQPQYWKDFLELYNSDFLLERRNGLKLDVSYNEISDVAKRDGIRGVINKILELGFTPTQLADSFAIASGGATYYRNKIKSYEAEMEWDGVAMERKYTDQEAKEAAFLDFREKAMTSQQSSDPMFVSQQQADPSIGRIILAFANTPSQYARIIKKAVLDLKNRRGSDRANWSKILYYGFAQNLLFNYLQQAVFQLAFDGSGDDDEDMLGNKKDILTLSEQEKRDRKIIDVANGMLDSLLRGTGFGGAILSVLKNTVIRVIRESKKDQPKYDAAALELLKISPPISSKMNKIAAAGKAFMYQKDDIKRKKYYDVDNPAMLAAANVISAGTNIPLDRLIKKTQNVKGALDSELKTWQRIALIAGWQKWQLGIEDEKPESKIIKQFIDKDGTVKTPVPASEYGKDR